MNKVILVKPQCHYCKNKDIDRVNERDVLLSDNEKSRVTFRDSKSETLYWWYCSADKAYWQEGYRKVEIPE